MIKKTLTINNRINITTDLANKVNQEGYKNLLRFLKDKNKFVRLEALDALFESYKKYLKKDDIYSFIYDSYIRIAANTIYFLDTEFKIVDKNICKRALEIIKRTKDELILTDMVEVLFDYIGQLKKEDIKFLLNHRSILVRRDAIILFSYISETSVDEINNFLKNQHSAQAKLGAYEALILKGEYKALDKIIKLLLTTKDYRARSASVNTLVGYVNKDNFHKILNAFYKTQKRESTLAVLSTLEKGIKLIEKEFKSYS